jgi:tripartite-type tricarboxylate transporter receptor subunit TctC
MSPNCPALLRAVVMAMFIAISCASAAHAQPADNFPSRPVTLVVGFAAGGAVDGEARYYANTMSKVMGQQFVLEYKTGAGGTLANAYAARARADGYTILLANASFTVYPAVYKTLPFDTVKDFAPVSLLSQRTSVLVVSPTFPANTLREYIEYARANPEKLNYATTGSGSVGHLSPAWLHNLTKTKVTFVHYKGAAPQLLDLQAGRVDAASGNLLAQLPLIKAGKLKPLAIFTNKRSRLLPDLPSAVELVPAFNYTNWIGMVVPSATPAPIIGRLNEGFVQMTKDPELISAFDKEGLGLVGSTPAEFAKHIATELALWKRVVAENNITLDEQQ